MLQVTDKKLIEYCPDIIREAVKKKQSEGLAVGTEIDKNIVGFQGQAPWALWWRSARRASNGRSTFSTKTYKHYQYLIISFN